MRGIVFVGPTLNPKVRPPAPDIEFRPPVKKGDLLRLLDQKNQPLAIGIVDGTFFQNLSVSPKEVIQAIDAGIQVFGSSSMGALRAAECSPYGMIGVGKIYEEFSSNRIDADDEVAIIYDEDGLRPLSEPLINMRFAIAFGIASSAFSADTGARFLEIAQHLYFPLRTIPAVMTHLRGLISDDEHAGLSDFLATSAPDTKHDDAILLLTQVRLFLLRSTERS